VPQPPRSVTPLSPASFADIVRRALAEDVGRGDVTTEATVPAVQQAHGVFVVKQPCVLAGEAVVREVFRQLDPATLVTFSRHDGDACPSGDLIGEVEGAARALLIGERLPDENPEELEELMQRCEDVMHGDKTSKKEVLRLTSRLREIEAKLGLQRRKKVKGKR